MKRSAMYSAVFHGQFSSYERIRLAHTSGRNPIILVDTVPEFAQNILNNQNLVTFSFCEWALQDAIKPDKDKVVVITDQKAPLAWSGVPMHFGWQHSDILKWSMMRIDETGIFWKFFRKYHPSSEAPGVKTLSGKRVFKLTDMAGALWVIVYGYLPGIALLLLEIWWTNFVAQDNLFTNIMRMILSKCVCCVAAQSGTYKVSKISSPQYRTII